MSTERGERARSSRLEKAKEEACWRPSSSSACVRERLHILQHAWLDDLLKPALTRPPGTNAYSTSGCRCGLAPLFSLRLTQVCS